MKAIYKLAVISIVLGLAMSALGVALGGGNAVYVNGSGIHVLKNNSKNARAQKITELDLDRFKSIDIEARYSDVEFIESDKYGMEIVYYDIEPSWSLSNGNLNMKVDVEKDNSYSFYLFNWDWNWNSANKNHIKVYMPKSAELEKVNIRNGSGNMNIGGFYASDVTLRCSSGKVNISGIEGDNVDISLTSGSFEGKKLAAENIAIKSSSGKVSFTDVNARSLEAGVTSGSVYFYDCKVDGLDVTSSSGKIISERLYTGDLRLKVTSGRIDLEGGFSGRSEISSSSGSISITTSENKESYSCDLSVSSGRVTYDNERYEKRVNIGESRKNTLFIRATSGNIDVNFR